MTAHVNKSIEGLLGDTDAMIEKLKALSTHPDTSEWERPRLRGAMSHLAQFGLGLCAITEGVS